ncbi:hypothetical protein BGX31_005589 [Mortierella sp. GBA43]|nr:hypothetical protein BGX31_005589 [Mortierella sp. GBA43]
MAKNTLIRTLSTSSALCSRRPLCQNLHQRVIALPTRASFSSTPKASEPSKASPAAAPASAPRSTLSVSASNTPAPIPRASAAVAAVPAELTTSLPFSYDPTGLSTKKPSCDNLNLKNSFYRRKLPEHLVSFTSPKGKQMFKEMLEEGYGEGYFTLVGNFTTQSETAFCGPSSLAMVLNSLEVDPQRQWKGAWRWYSDELLECCAPTEQVKAKGITFNQFACLSKCHCDVQVRRANQTSLEQFKQDLEMVPIGGYAPKSGMVLVLDTARFKYPSYFVSVERLYESLFPIDAETGTSRGYFLLSANPDQPPISLCKIEKSKLGPNPSTNTSSTGTRDMNTAIKDLDKLNLDANPTIHATPSSQDSIRNLSNSALPSTGAAPFAIPAVNCSSSSSVGTSNTMDSKMSWTSLAQTFCKDLPSRIQVENPQTLNQMVSVVLHGVPREYAFWISQQQAHRLRDTTELIDSIKSTELYSLVSSAFPAPATNADVNEIWQVKQARQQHEGALVFGTLFLMSSPRTLFLTLPVDVSQQFEKLRQTALDDTDSKHRVLKEEVERMRTGIVDLVNSFCSCGPNTKVSA